MRVICKHCGGAHPAFECRKKESTAALKEVQGPARPGPDRKRSAAHDTGAGTQALPVDTNLEGAHRLGSMPQTVNRGEASSEKPTSSEARFDKKAWMRDYMREHRRGIRRRAAK